MTRTAPCVGCLGTLQCWICSGDGCQRCEASGACHVCEPPAVARSALHRLVPRQPTSTEEVVRGRR